MHVLFCVNKDIINVSRSCTINYDIIEKELPSLKISLPKECCPMIVASCDIPSQAFMRAFDSNSTLLRCVIITIFYTLEHPSDCGGNREY